MPPRKCMKCYRHFKTRIPYEGHKCPLRSCTCNGCLPKRRSCSRKRGRIPKYAKTAISEMMLDNSQTPKKDVNLRTAIQSYASTSKSAGNPSMMFYAKRPLQMMIPTNQAKTFHKNDLTKPCYQVPIYLQGTQLGLVTITESDASSSLPATSTPSEAVSKAPLKPLPSLENANVVHKEAIHVGIPKTINWTLNVKKSKTEGTSPIKCFISPAEKLPHYLLPPSAEKNVGKLSNNILSLSDSANLTEAQRQAMLKTKNILMNCAKSLDFSNMDSETAIAIKKHLKSKAFDIIVKDVYHFRKLYPTLPEWTILPIYVACNGNFLITIIELQNLLVGKTQSLKLKLHTYWRAFIARFVPKDENKITTL